jgi:hypothetical protein
VDADDLVRANSRMMIADSTGEQFIGPALGGLAFAAAASLPVIADSASFAASAAILALALRPVRRLGRHGMRRDGDGFSLEEPSSGAPRPSFLRQIQEGVKFLISEPRLRLICGLIASFAFCQALGLGIMVIYCTRVLHLDGTGFGLFTAAVATGNIVGAWVAPRVDNRVGAGRTLFAAGLLAGSAYVVVGATSSTAVALAALIAEALAVGVGSVVSIALRQRLIPINLAGRVSSAMRSCFLGAAAIATLVGGGLVVLVGAHAPFAIGGVIQLLAAIVIGGALARRLSADERDVVDLTEAVDVRESPVDA